MTTYIRKEILNLKGYHLSSYPKTIKLNQNEIPYDIPGELKAKVLEKLILVPWNRYPLPQPVELISKLSTHLNWPQDGILISNGSNVLIQALTLATSLEGRVLTIDPTFSLYELEAKVLNAQVQAVRLNENFTFPLENFLEAIRSFKPTLIFIPNPNAPTGNLFPKDQLLQVIRAASCLVVIDEAYFQFADENLMEELAAHPNLILLRTFSKAFGLGGVRMGYALGAPEILSEVFKVMLPYCVSTLNEAVAEAILEHPELTEKRVAEIKIERASLYQTLLGFKGVKVYPSQTNFLIFQVDDSQRVFQSLLQEKILLRDVSHPISLPNTLRVTVGSPDENEKFVKALKVAMGE